MGLLPLVPSAHPSAWLAEPVASPCQEAARIFERDGHACRFCGLRAAGRQDLFHLDGDHDRAEPDNLVTSCPLCHAAQHLAHRSAGLDLLVIWLPEMSQAALNCLAREIHLAFHRHGEPARSGQAPQDDTAELRAAWRAYGALAERAGDAVSRVGTSSPCRLAAALAGMGPKTDAERAKLLGGLRLLSLGCLHRAGRDIYPDLLTAWSRP